MDCLSVCVCVCVSVCVKTILSPVKEEEKKEKNQERENKLGKLNLEKSRNLHEPVKASQAKLSDTTGWEDRQPITAGDTEDAVMSSSRQSLYRDWSRGEHFWATSESEGGRQVGD